MHLFLVSRSFAILWCCGYKVCCNRVPVAGEPHLKASGGSLICCAASSFMKVIHQKFCYKTAETNSPGVLLFMLSILNLWGQDLVKMCKLWDCWNPVCFTHKKKLFLYDGCIQPSKYRWQSHSYVPILTTKQCHMTCGNSVASSSGCMWIILRASAK